MSVRYLDNIRQLELILPFGVTLHAWVFATTLDLSTLAIWVGALPLLAGLSAFATARGSWPLLLRFLTVLFASSVLVSGVGGSESTFFVWLVVLAVVYPLLLPGSQSLFAAAVLALVYVANVCIGRYEAPAALAYSPAIVFMMLGVFGAQISAQVKQVRSLRQELNTDALTGIGNRRYLLSAG